MTTLCACIRAARGSPGRTRCARAGRASSKPARGRAHDRAPRLPRARRSRAAAAARGLTEIPALNARQNQDQTTFALVGVRNAKPYTAPWWLPGGHLQTIMASLLPPPRVALERERWDTP